MKIPAIQSAFVLGSVFLLTAATQQNFAPHPPKFISPDSIAREKTVRLKKELQLTDQQYDKIYRMLLKEEQKRLKERIPRPPFPEGHYGMAPRPGHPPFAGEGTIASRPMGETVCPPWHPERESLPPDLKKDEKKRQKRIARKEKKMKKILTPEQFGKWKAISCPFPECLPGKRSEEIPEP